MKENNYDSEKVTKELKRRENMENTYGRDYTKGFKEYIKTLPVKDYITEAAEFLAHGAIDSIPTKGLVSTGVKYGLHRVISTFSRKYK